MTVENLSDHAAHCTASTCCLEATGVLTVIDGLWALVSNPMSTGVREAMKSYVEEGEK